jgi:DNA-directed RNA polymerase subunit N (RpoN/RPB10)
MAARIRCTNKICTCGAKLAKYQGVIELRIEKGENPIKILDDMKFTKMCCRSNLLNPPTFPIIDTNAGRLTFEDRSLKIMNNSSAIFYGGGNAIKLENVPNFPFKS